MPPWDQLSGGQKLTYMGRVVTPRMKELFRHFDEHRYPDMGCFPCHQSGKESSLSMPNPDLLLDVELCAGEHSEGPAAYKAEGVKLSTRTLQSMARMSRFMREQVNPEMARLLGRNAREYSCYGCHTEEN